MNCDECLHGLDIRNGTGCSNNRKECDKWVKYSIMIFENYWIL